MTKKRFRWISMFAAVWMMLFQITAFAGASLAGAAGTYERVYDMADLFTDEQEKRLSGKAKELRESMKMDLAVVTTEDAAGYTAQQFADKFYNDNGMGTGSDYSGVLFLIDMDNREITVSTEGKMIRYMTDGRIETILDDAYAYVSEGDFYGAAEKFLEDTEICYRNGISQDQYNQDVETGKISRYRSIRWYEALFALAAAAVCGFTAVGAVVREYGMKNEASRMVANFRLSYRKDSALRMGNTLADVLLGTFVTQQVIARQQNRTGGGGFGGGKGLSSGGRSSTHSFGGHTHGGGSRKF